MSKTRIFEHGFGDMGHSHGALSLTAKCHAFELPVRWPRQRKAGASLPRLLYWSAAWRPSETSRSDEEVAEGEGTDGDVVERSHQCHLTGGECRVIARIEVIKVS